MTFLELQTEVLRFFGEPVPPSVSQNFALVADAKAAINEGYETISEASRWYEKTTSINIVNSLYYNLNDPAVMTGVDTEPLLLIKGLFSAQNNRWMRQTFWRELDEEIYPAWELSIGEPDYFLMRGAWWLGLHPHKTSASGTMRANHIAMPTLLSADADLPGFPQEFHQGLVSYATYDLYCQDKEWAKAKRKWAEYLKFQDGLIEYVQHREALSAMRQFGGWIG